MLLKFDINALKHKCKNNIMQTYLSPQGYSVCKAALNDDQLKQIKNDLTVTPFVPKDYAMANVKPFKLYQEGPTKIYMPRHYATNLLGQPTVNKIPEGEHRRNLIFKGSLREEQQEPVNAFMKSNSGGILNLTCASGKTVLAIYIMCQLKVKTMVIMHKDFLLQQWKERIAQFAPSASVGLIKAKTVDVEDKDIVVASLQSLSMKDYDAEIFKGFGLVVVDEAHHTSAEVFSRALRKVCFQRTLGLSATVQRKDGLSKVFMWYLGDILYSNVKRVQKDKVDIHLEYFNDDDPCYSGEEYMMGHKLNIAKMINKICEFSARINFVSNKICDILKKEPSRRIIVLSDRRLHLELIGKALSSKNISNGNYFGGMKPEELKESETKQVILGTFCMVSEGFDCKFLDTLVLASPKSDVIQSVGRILREEACARRHIPIVVDIIDSFSIFERQAEKRIKYYKKQKYTLIGQQKPNIVNEEVKLKSFSIQELEKID